MSEFDDLIAELKQKRDELRVQMHLASKDIQDEWKELEAKMDDFAEQAKLEETTEGVGQALAQLGTELKTGFERVRDAIRRA